VELNRNGGGGGGGGWTLRLEYVSNQR